MPRNTDLGDSRWSAHMIVSVALISWALAPTICVLAVAAHVP